MTYYHWRKFKNILFHAALVFCAVLVLTPLFLVLGHLIKNGIGSFSWDFLTNTPAPIGQKGGGMAHAILGTLYILSIASVIALPMGIACGIYLSEYGRNKSASLLKYAVDVLTGAPSIVVGIFAYTVVVIPFKSFSALAGGVALAVIILPIVTRSTEEILKLVPNHIREAGLALGLPRWKVILHIVVKGNFSSLITGIMLAVSRAAGESAPLLFTAFGSMAISTNLMQPMASLPVQIYSYAISPYKQWQDLAWAGSLLLIMMVFSLNLGARLILNNKNIFRKLRRKQG